jgi:hypothetical protein
MNFILRILIIGILTYYISSSLPWWSIIFIPFLLGLIFEDNYISHFLSGFIGVSISWIFLLLSIEYQSESILSSKVIEILKINSINILIIFTALIGGIISALSSITGLAMNNIFKKKEDKRNYRFS